jgi:hypothetical protein
MISDIRFLDRVEVASPCPASWDGMKPVDADGAVRYCGECRLNVYNLSDMTSDQAEALLREHEGKRLCVAFFRRTDGTVLTRDCPVGLKIARRKAVVQRARMVVSLSVAISSLVIPSLVGASPSGKQKPKAKIVIVRQKYELPVDRTTGSLIASDKYRQFMDLGHAKAKIKPGSTKAGSKHGGKTGKKARSIKVTVGPPVMKPTNHPPQLLGEVVAQPPKTDAVKPKAHTPPILGRIASPAHLRNQNKQAGDTPKDAEPRPGK